MPILRHALRVLAGGVLLVAALWAGPPVVSYVKTRLAPPPAPTWNDVARRLAEFQKEQPGLGAPPLPPPAGGRATQERSPAP